MTKDQAAAYLAAMIDGEGHIRVRKNRSASVANTDWDLIEATVECCELLGLEHRVTKATYTSRGNRKPVWEVRMTGKDTLLAIQATVPLRSARKRQALAQAIALYRYKRRPPREWVEQKYLVEKCSLQECAEAWGVRHSASAFAWLTHYGIPARSSSEANIKVPVPAKDALHRLYVNERRPVAEIARLLGAHNEAMLYRWLHHHGIPLRNQGDQEHGS